MVKLSCRVRVAPTGLRLGRRINIATRRQFIRSQWRRKDVRMKSAASAAEHQPQVSDAERRWHARLGAASHHAAPHSTSSPSIEPTSWKPKGCAVWLNSRVFRFDQKRFGIAKFHQTVDKVADEVGVMELGHIETAISYSTKCRVKPWLQFLRFYYDTTTIRRYHDAFDYKTEVIEITICVRFDCDTTTIRLRCIARACFHSTRCDASKKMSMSIFRRSRIVVV